MKINCCLGRKLRKRGVGDVNVKFKRMDSMPGVLFHISRILSFCISHPLSLDGKYLVVYIVSRTL